ncbi:MAG: alpha/beta hydrolase [Candidatus Freyarchaeota archaeon]
MVSKEMEMVINLLREYQASQKEPSVEDTRKGLEQLASLSKLPEDVKCEPIDAGGVPAEWITTPEAEARYAILYLHGGGYVAGSIKTHRDLASRISRTSKARVLLIDYRLAPEHPFPAAVEDVTTAYRWLVSAGGIEPNNLIVTGDSAGGGLTVASLVNLRDEGDTLPAGAVCLSPWTDLACTGETLRSKAEVDPFITPEGIEFMARVYLKDADPKNPLASPLYADLKGLPPMLIQVGTSEILLDDSLRLADRAKAAGVNVELDVWEDMIHVFAAFAAFAPEGRQAIERIGEFVKKIFS